MINGLGRSIQGIQSMATNKKHKLMVSCWILVPINGAVLGVRAPMLRAMFIIFVIIEGACPSLPDQSVIHFITIIVSMYPNKTMSKIIYGINSVAKSRVCLK